MTIARGRWRLWNDFAGEASTDWEQKPNDFLYPGAAYPQHLCTMKMKGVCERDMIKPIRKRLEMLISSTHNCIRQLQQLTFGPNERHHFCQGPVILIPLTSVSDEERDWGTFLLSFGHRVPGYHWHLIEHHLFQETQMQHLHSPKVRRHGHWGISDGSTEEEWLSSGDYITPC